MDRLPMSMAVLATKEIGKPSRQDRFDLFHTGAEGTARSTGDPFCVGTVKAL
jgi:elongation factor P--beta-lysine ligase